MNTRRAQLPVLTILALAALSPPVAVAHHVDIGVLNANYPTLTIGAPWQLPASQQGISDEYNDTYSGIRLTIDPSAPAEFRFSIGEALWLDRPGVATVDTALEQSFLTIDPEVGLALLRNRPVTENPVYACCIGPWGLLVGNLFADVLDSELTSGGTFDEYRHSYLNVEYRLTGSGTFLPGSIAVGVVIPEPSTTSLLLLGLMGLGHIRAGRSHVGDRGSRNSQPCVSMPAASRRPPRSPRHRRDLRKSLFGAG